MYFGSLDTDRVQARGVTVEHAHDEAASAGAAGQKLPDVGKLWAEPSFTMHSP